MTSNAQKLLEDMRNSKANWKRRDLDALYEGFGFNIRHGSSHDIIMHPQFRQLRTTLPRHGEVLKFYVTAAVKLVDRLIVLQEESQHGNEPKGKGGNAS